MVGSSCVPGAGTGHLHSPHCHLLLAEEASKGPPGRFVPGVGEVAGGMGSRGLLALQTLLSS